MDGTWTIDGSDLVAPAAALQWHEAVAVVLQLTDTIKELRAASLPDLPHIQLFADGTIAILPGAPSSGQPVTQLATILTSLLQGAPAPPELVQLVAQAASGSDQSIDGFAKALRYFERPARQAVLRAAVERIAISVPQARIAAELRRVVEKARAASQPAAERATPTHRRSRKLMVVVLFGLVVLLGAAAVVWWRFPRLLNGSSSVVTRATQAVAQAFNSAVDRVFAGPATEQTPELRESVPSRPKPASPGVRRKRADPQALGAQPLPAAPEPAGVAVPTLTAAVSALAARDPVLLTAPELPPITPEPLSDADRIYSRLDPGVTPPVPLQPLLGRITTDVVAVPGDMEVLVDRTGAVERVRLLVPNRYQDRMLIYAVKSRIFKPALVDGRPVRYLLRMRTGF